MNRELNAILPAKLAVLLVHFAATGMIYTTKFDILQIALGPDDSGEKYTDHRAVLSGLLAASMICFSVEVVSIFSGASLDSLTATLFSIGLHAPGAFLSFWLVADGWTWRACIWIFCLFTLPPALMEIFYFITFAADALRSRRKRSICCGLPQLPCHCGVVGRTCQWKCSC